MAGLRVEGSRSGVGGDAGVVRDAGERSEPTLEDRITALQMRCIALETNSRSLRRDVQARPLDKKTRVIRRDRRSDANAASASSVGQGASADGSRPFLLAFEASPFAQCFVDAAGIVHNVNRAALRLLDLTPGECVGRSISELVDERDAAALEAFLVSVLVGERPNGAHLRLELGARRLCVELSLTVVVEGVDALCLLSLRDLSELRAVQEDEARFRRIAAHVEDVYYEADRMGRVVYVSTAYELVWRRDPMAAQDKPWLHAVHADDLEHVMQAQRLLLKGDPFDEEYRIILPDGHVRWVRDRACLVELPVPHIVGVARDITDDRDLEEELRQGQKLEAIGALASSVAHDFGNLLQGVMGCLNLALNQSTSSERAQEYTRQALSAVRSGATLVGQLTTFGRKEQTRRKPVEVDAAIASCAKLLQRLLGEHIDLRIEAGSQRAMILADPIQIEQILMNLAANARDAMPGGGRLLIRTHELWQRVDETGRQQPVVRLEVRDIGCGMDGETQARVFEPFFTTKALGKGTGLGLSTVRTVTRALGGQVELSSEVGHGTAFIFEFPCITAPCQVLEPFELPEARFTGRALLVEDDWCVRVSVRQYLEDLGFEVVEAGDAVEALSRARGSFTVLVSDVVLPEVSGRRVLDILRSQNPELQALYISAHPAPYLIEQGLLEPSDAVLQKPFERRDLALRLAELCPPAPIAPRRELGLPVS